MLIPTRHTRLTNQKRNKSVIVYEGCMWDYVYDMEEADNDY